jgi:hypothetical protein
MPTCSRLSFTQEIEQWLRRRTSRNPKPKHRKRPPSRIAIHRLSRMHGSLRGFDDDGALRWADFTPGIRCHSLRSKEARQPCQWAALSRMSFGIQPRGRRRTHRSYATGCLSSGAGRHYQAGGRDTNRGRQIIASRFASSPGSNARYEVANIL